jgi:hypothetical protein
VDPDGRDPDNPDTWIFGGPSDYVIWKNVGEFVTTTTVMPFGPFGGHEKSVKTKVLHQPFPKLCNNSDAVGFVKNHESEAAAVAKQLGIPTEFVLGLSAIESTWGKSNAAVKANNFFGLHGNADAPFANGVWITSGGVSMSAPLPPIRSQPNHLRRSMENMSRILPIRLNLRKR